jgi:KDO2-lipid IV(A) lauroyltransferase
MILNSDKNIDKEVKSVFHNFSIYLMEFLRMDKMLTPDFIEENVKIENLDAVKKVLKESKGGIILSAHIGNWEMGGTVISRLGFPFAAVALPHKERPVNQLFNYQREVHGVTVIPSNIGVRKCLEYLKANKLVALVGDRDFGNHGEILDFLGGQASIPKGPAIFSLKTGAPIIPSFFIRNDNRTFTFYFSDPIYPPAQENHNTAGSDEVIGLMKKYIKEIEKKIRQFPTQWLVFREFNIK